MFDKLNRIQLLIAYSCYKLISIAWYLNNGTGSLIYVVTPLPSVSIVTAPFVQGPRAGCVSLKLPIFSYCIFAVCSNGKNLAVVLGIHGALFKDSKQGR